MDILPAQSQLSDAIELFLLCSQMRVEVKTVEVCEADLRAAAERETAEYNATLSALVNGEYDYTTSRTVYCATSQHAESLAAAFLEKSVIKFRDIWSPKPFGELPNPDERKSAVQTISLA